jgi:arsenate reductase
MLPRRYRAEIENVHAMLKELSDRVLSNIHLSINAVIQNDGKAANEVFRKEDEINRLEVRLEESCLRVMTLHHPVADEMRFLVAVTKVNHDLERAGDLAAATARRVHELDRASLEPFSEQVRTLTGQIRKNLEISLNAFFSQDYSQATAMWIADDAIDAKVREITTNLREAILNGQGLARCHFAMLAIVHYLERLADHSANIAKHTIYLALGEIARHRMDEYRELAEETKPRVLVVCVHNSARSQMAAAWINHLYSDRITAESAGLQPGALNPLTVEVMKEVGIDISGSVPRDVFEVIRSGHPFSHVIRVCDESSAKGCPPFIGAREELNWNVPDPAAFQGEREVLLEKFREVRDELRRRIENWAKSTMEE